MRIIRQYYLKRHAVMDFKNIEISNHIYKLLIKTEPKCLITRVDWYRA